MLYSGSIQTIYNYMFIRPRFTFDNKKAVLSHGEPRDAAINFDRPTYRILNYSYMFKRTLSLSNACLCINTKHNKVRITQVNESNKKAVLSQRRPRDAPYISLP